ncbi:tyrosine-type recombinase/integrase [Nocardia cyriacigeorgica]|uniref:tyrosine-type recombinase/integrase n=1 Tax=Nocardia cyriacigeorgica TaxID=135487 RepID=UPI0024581085|nr:site-specific integrase [Nocardia cyriacigeorgica]
MAGKGKPGPKQGGTRRTFGTIRKLPSKRWQAYYPGPDGKTYRAPSTFAAKIDAEAWLTDRRREIDRDLWSPPTAAEQSADKTFALYAEDWLRDRQVGGRGIKERTAEHYRKILDVHLLPAFGTRGLRSLTNDDIREWYAGLCPGAPTMRSHAYGLAKSILASAAGEGLIPSNPCQIRGAGSAKRKITIRPATLAELETLVQATPERLRAMILLATWCALRFGELAELRRKDVELHVAAENEEEAEHRGVIRIRRAVIRVNGEQWVTGPKSEAGTRDVAIPPDLVPVIAAHIKQHAAPGPDGLLFPPNGEGNLQPSTVYRHFYKAREAAGRPDLRFHDLRHTGATLAAQAGATLAELMHRLGHSTSAAALRYQHVAADRDAEIARRLSAMRTVV